jgi:hypothetical protein
MAANALLVVRAGMQATGTALVLLGIAVALLAIAMLVTGALRRNQLARSVTAPSPSLIAFTAASVVFAALAGIAALVT